MKQIHKKALLFVVLLAAAFAGTMLALYPVWEHRQEQKKQEALLLQLEQQINEEDTASIKLSVDTKEIQKEKAADKKENRFSIIIEETGEDRAINKEIKTGTTKIFMPEAGAVIGMLIIPKIEAQLPVTAGVTKEQLNVSEGWVMQTAPIGGKGNAVIAGHRSYTWGRHFNRLEELEAGDEILFTTADGEPIPFLVSEILTADPDDPSVFALPPDGGAQLTLYTCTPVRIATHRLIVRAMRLEE